jgi:acyl-CoA thioester hydrolase
MDKPFDSGHASRLLVKERFTGAKQQWLRDSLFFKPETTRGNHAAATIEEIPVLHFDEYRYGFDFRVRFAETDAQAVVHNSNYLVYFEVGRTEYLRHIGLDYTTFMEHDYDFLLAVSHIDYRRPAKFDQMLHLDVAIEWIKRSSFQFRYRLTDAGDEGLIAEGYTIHATLFRPSGKTVPFPAEFRGIIKDFEGRDLIPPMGTTESGG